MQTKLLRRISAVFTLASIAMLAACGGGSSSSSKPPATVTLSSIALTATAGNMNVGDTRQFTATGHYSDGTSRDLSSSSTWSSSKTSVATVSSTGLVTAKGNGSATITATSNGLSGTSTVTVNVTLSTVSVTPATSSLAIGATAQLAATGNYSDSSTQTLTSSATWSSSNTSIATVSAGGLVTAKAVGSVTITATSDGVHGAATVTVHKSLSGITVAPSSATLTAGETQQLTVTGSYDDSSTQDLTSSASFTSSDALVGTVSASGLVTSLTAGSTTVTATVNSFSAASTFTVKAANVTLSSLAITPANQTLDQGSTLQLTATGTYSDASTADLSSQVSWSSSDATFATVDGNGLVSGVAAGTVQVSATLNGVSASTSVVVKAVVSSISIQGNLSLQPNTTSQLSAYATFSDGSQQDLTKTAQWSSSDTTVATIDANGLVTAVGQGTTTITVTINGVTQTSTLTVNPPSLSSIVLDQDGQTTPLGLPLQLTATGVFSDGSTATLTNVTFSSSDTNLMTIDANGLASTLATGDVTVTATVGSVSGTGLVTVGPQTLVSIAVTPGTVALPLTLKQQFVATGTFTDASTQVLTDGVTWSSSDASVASVDATGLASSLTIGSTTVTAQVGSVSGSASLNVNAAQLVSIAVSPATTSMPVGAAQQYVAVGTYDDASTVDITSTVAWSSSDGSKATVDANGIATGVAVGSVTVTASSGSISGTADLTINNATPATLAITPANSTVKRGTRVQFHATVTYNDGSYRDVTKQTTWSSSKSNIANIGTSGRSFAHKVGTATIKGKFDGLTGTTTLTVTK